VGQCEDLHVRLQNHISAAKTGKSRPVYEWIRGLFPLMPVPVVLEVVRRRRTADNLLSIASVMESKWLKRFRRTVLNYDREQCAAYEDFVNPPEVLKRYDE
jgi:hypothetical protein